MSFTHADGGDPTRTEVRASMMKVLIGVDPHKVSVAAAVVDEGTGELLECASFLHNRAGLRALERSKRSGSLSVVGRWRTLVASGEAPGPEGLAAAEESVVDVPSKLSARVRVLSTGNARKNDELDALWPPRWLLLA
jgi:transposase